MKKIEKRQIKIFEIFVLCIVLLAGAFLIFRSWLHSAGTHSIGSYGQIHVSGLCEGTDQDGNKIKSRNIAIDAVVCVKGRELGSFEGEINIDGLPEVNALHQVGGGPATKSDNGQYLLVSWYRPMPWSGDDWEEQSSYNAEGWIRGNQFAVQVYREDMRHKEYNIFYSNEEMLNEVLSLIEASTTDERNFLP